MELCAFGRTQQTTAVLQELVIKYNNTMADFRYKLCLNRGIIECLMTSVTLAWGTFLPCDAVNLKIMFFFTHHCINLNNFMGI